MGRWWWLTSCGGSSCGSRGSCHCRARRGARGERRSRRWNGVGAASCGAGRRDWAGGWAEPSRPRARPPPRRGTPATSWGRRRTRREAPRRARTWCPAPDTAGTGCRSGLSRSSRANSTVEPNKLLRICCANYSYSYYHMYSFYEYVLLRNIFIAEVLIHRVECSRIMNTLHSLYLQYEYPNIL